MALGGVRDLNFGSHWEILGPDGRCYGFVYRGWGLLWLGYTPLCSTPDGLWYTPDEDCYGFIIRPMGAVMVFL